MSRERLTLLRSHQTRRSVSPIITEPLYPTPKKVEQKPQDPLEAAMSDEHLNQLLYSEAVSLISDYGREIDIKADKFDPKTGLFGIYGSPSEVFWLETDEISSLLGFPVWLSQVTITEEGIPKLKKDAISVRTRTYGGEMQLYNIAPGHSFLKGELLKGREFLQAYELLSSTNTEMLQAGYRENQATRTHSEYPGFEPIAA